MNILYNGILDLSRVLKKFLDFMYNCQTGLEKKFQTPIDKSKYICAN